MTSLDFTNVNNELQDLYESNSYINESVLSEKYKIIQNNLENNVNLLNVKLDKYSEQLDFYNELNKVYETYSELNEKNGVVDDINKKSVTNDRKSFYEAQEYDNLILWYSRFWWFYYILAIIASIIVLLSISPDIISFTQKCIIVVCIFLYPYVIRYILMPFIWLYNFIYNFLPKNVYKNL